MANYEVLSHAAIVYLTGLIRDLASVSEGVDDLHLASNSTFSSVKIDTLIRQCLQDSNDYTDRLVANLSRLELKLVTSESEITQPNIMYLYKPSGSTSYEQYVVIEGTKVLLGTTDINMGDYYTITQADAKFVLKTDFDSLKTKVDGKVDKADIVDNLTSTNTDKPLSANQGKVLKDEVDLKANNDDVVKKTDIVTSISSTSTDDTVPSAKSIYTDVLSLLRNQNMTKEQINSNVDTFYIASIPSDVGKAIGLPISDKIYSKIINIPHGSYTIQLAWDIGKHNNIFMLRKCSGGVWESWQKVCTTKVADVDKTFISFSDETNYSVISNSCVYFVKNGMCHIMLYIKCNTPSDTWTILSNNIPKADGLHRYLRIPGGGADVFLKCLITMDGELKVSGGNAGVSYLGTFSYPVAES